MTYKNRILPFENTIAGLKSLAYNLALETEKTSDKTLLVAKDIYEWMVEMLAEPEDE